VHVVAWANLALLLAGCEQGLPAAKPLVDLHLPGVTKIQGIENLHSGPRRGVIDAVTAYMAGDGAQGAHVLFTEDHDLYDVGLDGSAPRSLALRCVGTVAVTADGRWAACLSDGGIALTALGARQPGGGHTVLPWSLGDPASASSPTWAPDGHHLAVVTHQGSGCSIADYTVSPTYDAVRLTELLDFPEFVTQGSVLGCTISGLSWSPNGSWLAFVADSHFTLYGLSLVPYLPLLLQPAGGPGTLIVPADMLIRLSNVEAFSPPVWSRVGGRLALTVVGDLQSIVRIDLVTRQRTVLLSVNEGLIPAVSWTPDGRQLIFALSQIPPCPECGFSFTPSQLYVFTPRS
jgi:hypothetical protein